VAANPANARLDSDGDGVADEDEIALLMNPHNPDTDGDGLNDGDEISFFNTNPTAHDTDGDGYDDDEELDAGTDPNDPAHNPASLSPPPANHDQDDPFAGDDTGFAQQQNLLLDSGSGVIEEAPPTPAGEDPVLIDTDGDGFLDVDELSAGSDLFDPASTPLNVAPPIEEPADTTLQDSDGDGFPDGNELLAGSDPIDPASTP